MSEKTVFLFVAFILTLLVEGASASCPSETLCVYVGAVPSPSSTPSPSPSPEPVIPEFALANFYCVADYKYRNFETGATWNSLIWEAAKRKGIEPKALCAILLYETRGNVGRVDAVGGKGECGGFQLMPTWFQNKGGNFPFNYYPSYAAGEGDPRSCFLPENNVEAAARVFLEKQKSCPENDLWCGFKRYNGGGQKAAAYATAAMNIYEKLA